MRRTLVCGAVGLLLTAGCSQPDTSHHAYVVVQHMSGKSIERTVTFTGSEIGGQAAMDASGIEYKAQSVTSGKVVCQVDNEPATFTTCFPQNQPYWALFVASGGHWSNASGGMTDVKLHGGEAIGWHYVPAGNSSPPPPPMPTGT